MRREIRGKEVQKDKSKRRKFAFDRTISGIWYTTNAKEEDTQNANEQSIKNQR